MSTGYARPSTPMPDSDDAQRVEVAARGAAEEDFEILSRGDWIGRRARAA